MDHDVCLLVLIGLPAVGKSTLAKKIITEGSDRNIQVEHVEFDVIEERLKKENGVEEFKIDLWQLARTSAYEYIDQLLTQKLDVGKKRLIIVDDNMYFGSMRKLYFKLAQKSKSDTR